MLLDANANVTRRSFVARGVRTKRNRHEESMIHHTRGLAWQALLPLTLTALACSQRGDRAAAVGGDTAGASVSAAAAPADSVAGQNDTAKSVQAIANADSTSGAGGPDQTFLRQMADHHRGLILISHETLERKENLAVKDEARKLDSEQDDGLDRIRTALKSDFNDNYQPKVPSESQAMMDTLSKQQGAAYDRKFREDVIAHHQKGLAMIDAYLPRATRPDVKTMAQRMREQQAREIAQMKRELGQS